MEDREREKGKEEIEKRDVCIPPAIPTQAGNYQRSPHPQTSSDTAINRA